MSVDAVPHLDYRKARRIVVVEQQLARTTAGSLNDKGNDRAKKVAKGLSGLAWNSFIRVMAMTGT